MRAPLRLATVDIDNTEPPYVVTINRDGQPWQQIRVKVDFEKSERFLEEL